MEQARNEAGLIENTRDAVIALCLTGIVAAASFRDLFRHSQHKSSWLFDMRWILPTPAAVVVSLAFYAYLLWLGITFYRTARSKERLVVACWFASMLLGWIKNLVSISTVVAIKWVQATCMLIALLAAVDIVVRIQRRRETTGLVPD